VKRAALLVATVLLAGLTIPSASATTSKSLTFQAEIWVDNWFALYINGKKVGEDSVPITIVRSFNSQKVTFTATYPFTVGFVIKDYVENASGLEYIGQANQQIGDGGAIMQIREKRSGKVVAATDKSWKIFVINTAPTNPECVTSRSPLLDCKAVNYPTPANWSTSVFKDRSWKSASEYSSDEVGVKEGYFDFSWSPDAHLIWSSDLKLDNTVFVRKVVVAPTISATATKSLTLTSSAAKDGELLPIDYTCDGAGISPPFSWSGVPNATVTLLLIMDSIPGPLRPGELDIGNHAYLTVFNIPPTATGISADAKNIGILGQNFQGKNVGYTPPCSQGPGAKIYTATLYALSQRLTISASEATLKNLISAISGSVIASSKMNFSYSRA
jgi:phosphatidylethanolamine-binding protein (PEBP) family uncharacterized protein